MTMPISKQPYLHNLDRDQLANRMKPGSMWTDHKNRRWAVIAWYGRLDENDQWQHSSVDMLNVATGDVQRVGIEKVMERVKSDELRGFK